MFASPVAPTLAQPYPTPASRHPAAMLPKAPAASEITLSLYPGARPWFLFAPAADVAGDSGESRPTSDPECPGQDSNLRPTA